MKVSEDYYIEEYHFDETYFGKVHRGFKDASNIYT